MQEHEQQRQQQHQQQLQRQRQCQHRHRLPLAALLVGILCSATLLAAANGHEFLKEKPSFLTPCHLHGPTDEKCLAEAFENLFTNWRHGVPGLKNLSPIDPFHVKRVRLQQHSENVADIQVELKDMMARGMSGTKLIKSVVNDKDYTIDFKLRTPKVDVEGDYRLKGRLLILNLDGQGKIKATVDDLQYSITFKADLKQEDGEYYFDITSVSSKIDKIGNFKIHFTNLFGGNQELEESAQALFTGSWREIFEIMRPAFSQAINAIMLDRYKKILNYIPARYFLDDLP